MEPIYTMDFGGGLKATATVDLELLKEARGKVNFLTVAFEGKLIPSAIPKYREWMLMIQQDAANLIDGKVLWGFQIAPHLVQWWEILPGSKGAHQLDMSKLVPQKKGKPKCKRCRGTGQIGRNFMTKQIIACPCTEDPLKPLKFKVRPS